MITFRSLIKRVVKRITKVFTGIVPKDRKLILFSAWFGEDYIDNSKYLFEYMLRHDNTYKLFWYTKNKELFISLKAKGIPVLYANSLHTIWLQCRAIMFVATVQTSDFNYFFYNKCFFLDLGHGFPGKPVGVTLGKDWTDWFHYCREGIQFFETTASKFAADRLHEWYEVDYDNCIFSNKPRIDVFFDKEMRTGINTNVDSIKGNHRLISYLPTHRDCGKKEIDINSNFDLDAIQKLCEESNSIFLIKKHFYHKNEVTDLKKYPNIFDLTGKKVDTQVLLAETDVLITDFSSCFNDYLILDRPIIFYAFDYDDYIANERDYYWKYDKIKAGYTAKTKQEFVEALSAVTKDWDDTVHKKERQKMRRVYFDDDVEVGSSREKLSKVIDMIIQGTYVPYNWDEK